MSDHVLREHRSIAHPHVTGRYTRRRWDAELGQYDEQHVEATCTRCGAKYGPTTCPSGRVRQRIETFAAVHAECVPRNPGSGDAAS